MSILGNRSKDKTPDSSRQALLWMHPSALVHFMTSKRWVIQEGHLPEDVQFHHVYYDSSRQVFAIVCTSNEFKSLKLGAKIPELPPISFKWWNPKDGVPDEEN
jgi:hypothetical protein